MKVLAKRLLNIACSFSTQPPRAAVLAAIQVPEDIAQLPQTSDLSTKSTVKSDASVLFHRYLNSGKLVNIHDWYQAFAVGLEKGTHADDNDDEDDDEEEPKAKRRRTSSRSPRKFKPSPKKAAPKLTEPTPEEWEMETKARFLRAFHELEYLGVLRQTRRKAEHIQRTVFDAPSVTVDGDDD